MDTRVFYFLLISIVIVVIVSVISSIKKENKKDLVVLNNLKGFWKEGTYQFKIDHISSDKYPNGFIEKGVVSITYENYYVLLSFDGSRSYNKNSILVNDIVKFEYKYFSDFNKVGNIFYTSSTGAYREGSIKSYNDVIIEETFDAVSEVHNRNIYIERKITKDDNNYAIEATYKNNQHNSMEHKYSMTIQK